MSTSINVAFVKQFEKEIHESYQRLGSKLRGTVRQANNVKGSSTVFQKVGAILFRSAASPISFRAGTHPTPAIAR